MSAIANHPPSRRLPVLTPSMQEATEQDRFTAIRAVDLSEMPALAGVAKLFVLVAAPHGSEAGIALSQPSENELLPRSSIPSNLFDAFKRAITQSGSNHINGDAVIGDVKVNFATMEAYRRGKPLFLTALEFKTLKYLMSNARRVISRDELLNEVWGYQNYPTTRTVDNQLAKLRKKLEDDPPRPVHLRTVRGVGYKFLP
jgi:Transcriptional regulatory protein, C terminal